MKTIHTRLSLVRILTLCRVCAVLVVLIALLLLSATNLGLAQGPDYTLEWWTADGGGAVGQGGALPYTLSGTIGQPDAAVWSGADYILVGGCWDGVAAAHRLYLPFVMKAESGW